MDSLWTSQPSLNPDFSWEPMPDGCLVYRSETGQVLTLNPAAELLLTYCDGTLSLREIYDDIRRDLDMPESEFLEAINRLVKEKALALPTV